MPTYTLANTRNPPGASRQNQRETIGKKQGRGLDCGLKKTRRFLEMPSFEYDENKSQTNQQKHGIDFIEAQKLWEDDNLLEITSKSETEPRYLIIGQVQDKHWTAVITYRSEMIRIISVRRSRTNEVTWYESRRI